MINTSTEAETSRVIDSIVLGFSSDPVLRWFFPEPQEYLTNSPILLELFGGRAFDHGSSYHIQNYTGAALWLPPNVHPDEEGLTKLFQDRFDGSQLNEVFSLFEQMDNFHPDEPCWHLAIRACPKFMMYQNRKWKRLNRAILRAVPVSEYRKQGLRHENTTPSFLPS